MIIELLSAGVASEIVKIGASVIFEDKAIKKMIEAYGKNADAESIVREKYNTVDRRLDTVIKKKRAIREHTIPMYIDVYERIKNIQREHSSFLSIENYHNQIGEVSNLNYMKEVIKGNLTDKQLLIGNCLFGVGGVEIYKSRKMLSDAKVQKSYANVRYSEAQSLFIILDAIEKHAERVSNTLALLNYLTTKSIISAKKIIDKNGDDPENYTMRELEIIMTCENMVLGLIDAINLPVVNEDGIIEHEAVELLNKTEENVRKLESKLR